MMMKAILIKQIRKETPNSASLGAFNSVISSGGTLSDAIKAAKSAVKNDAWSDEYIVDKTHKFTTDPVNNVMYAQKVLSEMGFKSTVKPMKGKTVMYYDQNEKRFFININADFFKNPAKSSMLNFSSQFWSSMNPKAVIYHEVAHTKFRAPNKFTIQSEKGIARRVSRYAQQSPEEFVAEVYAGLRTGRKYPQDIISLYNKYKRYK